MKNNLKNFILKVKICVSRGVFFLGKCFFRWLELFTNIFPEDSTGCKIRGALYKPFLKKCGKNFQVGIGAKLEHLSSIEIGDDVYIGHGCWLSGLRGGIELKDQAMLGPFVVIVSSNHGYKDNSFRFAEGTGSKIVIEEGCWLCTQSTITSGVRVGQASLVAAGAVVCKNVEPNSIVAGVPAKKIGDCNEKFNN